MEVQTLVLIILTLIFSFVREGVSIICYKCNSHIHYNDCEDIKKLSEERRSYYIVNCDRQKPHFTNAPWAKCRKIVQEVGNDTRIIRQCAVLGQDEGKCSMKTGTKNIKMEYCECSKDLCNSAFNYTANYHLMLSIFILPFLLRSLQVTTQAL